MVKQMWLPKPLEMGLVMGLLNNAHLNEKDSVDIQEGKLQRFKTMKEIIRNNPFWKSQATNFPKYIKPLIHKWLLIEEGLIKVNHKYRKKSEHYVWRLRNNGYTYERIINWCEIYDRLCKYDGSFSLATTNFKVMKNHIKKGEYLEYFLHSDYHNNIRKDIKEASENSLELERINEGQCKKNQLLMSYRENIRNMLKLEEDLKNFDFKTFDYKLDTDKFRNLTILKMKRKMEVNK